MVAAVSAPSNTVFAELWISWASMLRSYAGAHGLNTRHQAVVEVGSEEILLRVDSRWVRFTHGGMTRSEGGSLPFSMLEDGRVRIGDVTDEMDMAAEAVARGMMGSG